jgi:hypothetical protein
MSRGGEAELKETNMFIRQISFATDDPEGVPALAAE